MVTECAKADQRGVGNAVAALAAVLAIGAAALGGWMLFGRSEPTPWDKPATMDGSVVHLTYTGSECQFGDDVEVDEDDTRVVVTVRERTRALTCNDVGVTYRVDAHLANPLGTRLLLDGACERAAYSGYVQCGPGKATVEGRA